MRLWMEKVGRKLNSLFARIFLYFLSMTLLIFVIGIFSYIDFIKIQEHNFASKMKMNLSSSAQIMNTYIKNIQYSMVGFFQDTQTVKCLKPTYALTAEELTERSSISKSIAGQMRNLVGGVIDIVFVYLDDKIVLTSDGVTDYSKFFGKFYCFENYDAEFWKDKLMNVDGLEILPPSWITKVSNMRSSYIIPIVASQKVNGYRAVMVSCISANTFYKIFEGSAVFASSEFVLINRSSDFFLSTDKNLKRGDFLKIIDRASGTGKDTDFSKCELNGKKYILIDSGLEQFGWEYYSVTPLWEFYKIAAGIWSFIILTCLVLFGIGLVFSYLFSRKIYMPVKSIHELLTGRQQKTDDEYENKYRRDEFDDIKKGIDRLVTHEQNVKRKIKTISDEYLNTWLDYTFQGSELSHKNIVDSVLMEEYGFTNKRTACCVVKFNFKQEFFSEFTQFDWPSFINALINLLTIMIEQVCRVYVFEYTRNTYVCIVDIFKEGDREKLLDSLQNIVAIFENDACYLNINVKIGLGKNCETVNELGGSFNQALTAMAKTPEDRFCVCDADRVIEENSVYYSPADEKRVLNCLGTGNMEELTKVTESILSFNRSRDVSHKSMKGLFAELYNTGMKFADGEGVDLNRILSGDKNILFNAYTLLNLGVKGSMDHLLNFYERLVEQTEERVPLKSDKLANLAAEYIHNNYKQDLSLNMIASRMQVSPKYISRIFKKAIGMNISDYIAKVRINKAKEIIQNTDSSILATMSMVGFYSRTTFIRTFKKFEGILPTEYKEISSAKKENNS